VKGIILAGGSGTRLFPLTTVSCKQLLPIYDKPVIYYPLSTLMLAGIRDIMIISTPEDIPVLEEALGDGSALGIRLSYEVQEEPKGIPQCFLIAEEFIKGDACCLILGDNIFHGSDLVKHLQSGMTMLKGAHIFAHRVKDPERFGVAQFDEKFKVIALDEKPKVPQSNWAVTGIYFYDSSVVTKTKSLKPSARGELEITDLNRVYLKQDQLKVTCLGRGISWIDAGTPDALLEASNYVQVLEKRQGMKVACIEEVAYARGYIDRNQLLRLASRQPNSDYSKYLRFIADESKMNYLRKAE
jgi:glucose-1-phosphate thymidylyltransferase